MNKHTISIIFATFTLLFISISNASNQPYEIGIPRTPHSRIILAINMDSTVSSCYVNARTRIPIGPCTITDLTAISPTEITVAPNSNYAYISSNTHNTFFICHIDNYGELDSCKNSNFNFIKPREIAIDSHGQFLYITRDDGHISVCTLDQQTAMPESCKNASSDTFRTSNIAISPYNDVAYITEPKIHAITICKLNHDLTFNSCKHNTNPALESPSAIAVDPYGSYVYITDSKHKTVTTCKFIKNTLTFAGCPSQNIISSENTVYPTSIAITPFSNHAYISDKFRNAIYYCIMDSNLGTLNSCIPFYNGSFNNIISIAYR